MGMREVAEAIGLKGTVEPTGWPPRKKKAMNERSCEPGAGSSPIWFDHRGRSPRRSCWRALGRLSLNSRKV